MTLMTRHLPRIALLLCLTAGNALAASDGNDGEVVARVNGTPITRAELQSFIERQSQPVSEEQALKELINVELLYQQARKAGVDKDPKVQMEIKRSTQGVVASSYLKNYLDNLDISDEAIRKRYDEQVKKAVADKKEYKARHILVKSKKEAEEIIKQLDQGADFAELAKKRSTGPSGKNGGDLGWFGPKQMVKPFAEAAMKLKPGSYSKTPVQTQFGWHVILLEDTRPLEPPTFESVRQQLANQMAAEALRDHMIELQKQAEIETLVTPKAKP